MATARLANILKSRSPFSDEEIERMNEDDAWAWIHDNTYRPKPEEDHPGAMSHSGSYEIGNS